MADLSRHMSDANDGSRSDTRKWLARLETTFDIATLFLFVATVAMVDLFSH
jgi:hypothetical protein